MKLYTIFGGALIFASQLYTASSWPTSLRLPDSLALLSPNITLSLLQSGNSILNVTMAPRQVEDVYPIRNTNLVLTIVRYLDYPMTRESILPCLQGAATAASHKDPLSLVPIPWWSQLPSGEAKFGIVPAIRFGHLTWEDIFHVARGLVTYLETEQEWQQTSFYIADRERGSLGSGVIRKPISRAGSRGGGHSVAL